MKRPFQPSLAAFSLIELLTVVAVMSVLTMAGADMFRNLPSEQLTRGGDQLYNLAQCARAIAIYRNTQCALVVVTTHSANTQLSGRAAALMALDSNQNWVSASKWEMLGPAIVANEDSSTNSNMSLPTYSSPPSLSLQGAMPSSYTAFIFNPDGTIYGGNDVSRTLKVRPAHGSSANYYSIVFVPGTGAMHIERP